MISFKNLSGPKVVPQEITSESLEYLTKMLQRKPVIWDNIHANDYDERRVFLGPYKGRPLDLYQNTNGILTNPNCEFEANFVAFESLALWYKQTEMSCTKDRKGTYNPEDVLELVCDKWLKRLEEQTQGGIAEKKHTTDFDLQKDYSKADDAVDCKETDKGRTNL